MRESTIPLTESHPEWAKMWHPTKNGSLKPSDVNKSTKKKAWWKCPMGEDHEFESYIHAQVKYGCPYCSGQRTSKDNCLAALYPEIAKQWNVELNGELTPEKVTGSSAKKVWWKCESGHTWEARVFSRTKNGSKCPFCVGKKPTADKSLAVLYPELIKEWHPELNKELKPENFLPGSAQEIWWQCPKNKEHIWKTMIWHRIDGGRNGKGTGCPYCSNQIADNKNNLATNYPEIAAEWHPTKNRDLTPDKIVYGSHAKVWWKCPKADDHEWVASVSNRIKSGIQFGCPCCSGRKVVPSNCLATTHPKIASEWSPKNILKPTEVTYATNQKAWFICSQDRKHEWQARIAARSAGKNCPICASSKGEKAIKIILENNNIEFYQEFKFADCKNIRPLSFDFALFYKNKLIGLIEFNGKHHYVPISRFGGIDAWRATERDQIKIDYCRKNNIPLLVIPHWELAKIENALKDYLKIIL